MNILRSLMGVAFTWDSLFTGEDGKSPILDPGTWGWVQSLTNVLSVVLWVVLALVGAAGSIYAVYVGIKMARAESAEQREENKKRFINILVSVVVVIVLIVFFNVFLPAIVSAFIQMKSLDELNKTESGAVRTAIETAKTFLRVR